MSCRVLGLALPCAALLASAGCGGSAPTLHDVSGVVRFRDNPVAGAQVGLAGQEQVTSATGEFRFTGVPAGRQILDVRHAVDADGVFVGERRFVNVGGGESPDVRLPEPVTLHAVEVAIDGARLSWSPFSGAGFREYKVYRGLTRGLDENTGELVFVSTQASETEAFIPFTPASFIPGAELFYRLFVMDEYGKLAGSNLESIVVGSDVPRPYQLTLASARALSGPAVGVTWDGSHFWFMYQYDAAGYYTPKLSRLVEYDIDTGTELRSFSYEDEYMPAHGLAWTGSTFWTSYYETNVKSLDPDTGAVLKTWQQTAVDLDWDGAHLMLGDQGALKLLDPVTGAIVATHVPPVPGHRYSGVAHRPGEIWMASMWSPDIVILDEAGTLVGRVDWPVTISGGMSGPGGFSSLAFKDGQLAVLFDSQLYLYEIQAAPQP
jgi:hypothetical protein